MRATIQEMRYALRSLRRTPLVTLIAIITIAVGIGATTTIVTLANAVLLRKLPYQQMDRTVWLSMTNPAKGLDRLGFSKADFHDVESRSRSFELVSAFDWMNQTLSESSATAAPPERVRVCLVSPTLFELLGVGGAMGRTFGPGDSGVGRDHVAVISHELWVSRFGKDASLVGRTIRLNGETYGVIGIAPENFTFPPMANRTAVWVPLTIGSDAIAAGRSDRKLMAWGRLKPGTTLEGARSELKDLGAQLARENPDTNRGIGLVAGPASDWDQPRSRATAVILVGAVAFLLLVMCANVASLLLAKAAARRKEVATMLALGARPGHIVRRMLVESIMLAAVGGIGGVLIALAGAQGLNVLLPRDFYRVGDVQVDPFALGAAASVAVITGILFGLAPAWMATHLDVNTALRESSRNSEAKRTRTFRMALVVAELALSFVLLVGAGLLARSLWQLQHVDLGYHVDHLLALRVDLPESQYPDANGMRGFVARFTQRVAALPGVTAVAVTNDLPLAGGDIVERRFVVEGQKGAPEDQAAIYQSVNPDYFRTLAMPIRAGRAFTASDAVGAAGVAIVDEPFARKYLSGVTPVGQRVRILGPAFGGHDDYDGAKELEIVGVVPGTKQWSPTSQRFPRIYVPFEQKPWPRLGFAIRTSGPPQSLITSVRRELHELDQNQAAFSVSTLEERHYEWLAQDRWNLTLTGMIAGLALLLAAVGTYGVMAYVVARRQSEIAIRKALGAETIGILLLVLRQTAVLAGVGLAIGFVGAWIGTRLLTNQLYEVTPFDPLILTSVSMLLLIVAMSAGAIPAWRAARADPAGVLRLD
jgi:putative ABC transport system permease protein